MNGRWRRGRASRLEREIRDELELHVELRTADNVAAGMSPETARRAAESRFGDLERILAEGCKVGLDPASPLGRFPGHEQLPHQPGLNLMSDLLSDLKYGFRMLRKSPGFTLAAMLSLALGIGFNSTMFTVIDAVMFKPLAVEDPDSLVRVHETTGQVIGGMLASYPDYLDIRAQAELLSHVAGFRTEMTTYNNDGNAEFVFGESVVAELFDTLGVQPILGRSFAPDEDDHRGGDFVVMVSEPFWRTRLGGDPAAIGRQLQFGGNTYTLIGVVPERYKGGTPPIAVHFWVPISMVDIFVPSSSSTSRLDRRGASLVNIVARLEPGASLASANEEIAAIGSSISAEYPDSHTDWGLELLPAADVRVDPRVDGMMLPAGGVLMGVVGLVLLIACANVANMMLARGSVRHQEVAVRQAMGASRGRLIRQLLTESLILASVAGVLAVAVAAATIRLLLSIQPPVLVPIDLAIGIDPRVLVFTGLVSVLTGLLFGVVPALRSTRADLTTALRAEDPRGGGTGRGNGLRNTLVVVQVAVSLVLLTGAGLLVRSLVNAQTIDPGIRSDSVVTISLGLIFQGYSAEQARDFHLQMLDRVDALPGVQVAGYAERLPLESTTTINQEVWIQGVELEPGQDPESVMKASVTPQYFEVLGIGIRAGRGFGPADVAEAPPVAIINDAFAEHYWPGENPLGKRFSSKGPDGPWLEVVGINTPHKISTLGEDPTPNYYVPLAQDMGSGFGQIVARTSGDDAATLTAMRRLVGEMDSSLAVMEAKTIRDHLSLSLFPVRLAAAGLGVLGGLGALLAAIGVYGVVAFGVAQRTHEIGIRMAVGADRGGVVRLILRQGMRVVFIGGAIGLAISFALTRVLGAILYGVSATDLLAFGAAGVGLAVVATVANLIPALRASRVDPVAALRAE